MVERTFKAIDELPEEYSDKMAYSNLEKIANYSSFDIYIQDRSGSEYIIFWDCSIGEGMRIRGADGMKHFFLNRVIQELAEKREDCRNVEYYSGITQASMMKVHCDNCGNSYLTG